MRRAGLVFVAVLAFLVLLGTPFLHARFGAPDASILPGDVQSRRGFDQLYGDAVAEPVGFAGAVADHGVLVFLVAEVFGTDRARRHEAVGTGAVELDDGMLHILPNDPRAPTPR